MFTRPGITALRDQAIGDMLIQLGLPTLLRRSPLRALAYAQAGLAYGQYGYLDWIARQAVPFTATGIFLEAWAALVEVFREPSTPATGIAQFVGSVGAVIPAGAVLRGLGGSSYVTLADCTLAGNGTGSAAIQSTVAGSAYTITDGFPLSLASPIFGVQTALSALHDAPGTDPELDDPFRTRMLLRWAEPPQGGAAKDYVQWTLAVPGVTRAWVNPLGAGPDTVVVYTMWDIAEAANAGFPQGSNGVAAAETRATAATGDQLVVANALYPLRPATALVYSVSPIPYPVPFTIHGQTAVPVAIQPAIAAAIDAVFIAEASPLAVELELASFEVAIAAVAGMPRFTLTAPAGPILAPLGSLPMRGVMTYA